MITNDNKIIINRFESPAGALVIGAYGDRICMCDWEVSARMANNRARICKFLAAKTIYGNSPTIDEAIKQIIEYFAGRRREFTLPILMCGTDFQLRVWRELLTIPYGETIIYSEQARRLGCPSAVRAVAAANGANAISIIVPCHRVIGANNKLTGYAGGLGAKRYLLELESKMPTIAF